MSDSKSIGNVIKEVRLGLRLQKNDFAKRLKLSAGYITRLETGSAVPSLELAFRIENVFALTQRPLSKLVIQAAYDKAREGIKGIPEKFEEVKSEGVKVESMELQQVGGEFSIPIELPKKLFLKLELR